MFDRHKNYKLKADVVFQPMDDSAIIVSLNSEDIFKLNATGTQIVSLIVKDKSFEEIITVLKVSYIIAAVDLIKEVNELIDDLFSAGLIEEVSIE
jgi:hypothetical protein